MITIPALKVTQFRMEFYQAVFSSSDVAKLVEFIVLDGGARPKKSGKRRKATAVNWQMLESLVKTGDTAYQRPLIKKKIEELVGYYQECSEEDKAPVPAIPGAVILVAREKLGFTRSGPNPGLGMLQIPEQYGVLHALDGQHRLIALHAAERLNDRDDFQVPAVIFDSLQPAQEVEMFATINCKQTKLNSSLLVHLAGKRLYQDRNLIAAHEVARKLNEDENSPLFQEIKMLGVGKGKITQASITSSLIGFFSLDPPPIKDPDQAKDFFIKYFKQLNQAFPEAWAGRKYSIKGAVAIRAFILAAPEVIARLKQNREQVTDALAIRRVIDPWKSRVTSARFETQGEWQRKLATSPRKSADLLARELVEALELEEE